MTSYRINLGWQSLSFSYSPTLKKKLLKRAGIEPSLLAPQATTMAPPTTLVHNSLERVTSFDFSLVSLIGHFNLKAVLLQLQLVHKTQHVLGFLLMRTTKFAL